MNRNRKKTVLPLEYQVESFFKRVINLDYELVTKKIEKNSQPPDIENLDLKTLIYEGMKRYEELIKIFKINSEKEKGQKKKSHSKKRHKYAFIKNRTDILNFGNRRSKIENENENENEYRYKKYERKFDYYNNDNNDLNNSKESKKNIKLLRSSYDKRNLNYKKNKDDKNNKRSIILNKDGKHNSYSKSKKNSKNKKNNNNKNQNLNDYDYDRVNYNKYDDEDKYKINKFNDNDIYEKERNCNMKERVYYYDNDNDRYDKFNKRLDYDNDYKEKYNGNEDDNQIYSYINKENYNSNKFNINDIYKEKEDKLNKYSIYKETKYETFKRYITDDKINKNSINMKRANNSIKNRHKYKYNYIGNKDKSVSEISVLKQNRWMKRKTNISNSILSRSKYGDYDKSQEISGSRSKNMWLKKRAPISTLNKNQTFEKEDTKKYIKNLKMNGHILGNKYERHFNDIGSQEKKNSHENIKDIMVKSQRIGNDIYNINYGKIVNKNMYINIYKTEAKTNNIFFQKQRYEKKGKNDENNVYNYIHNYYNIYKEEDDDIDNNYEEYGKKLVGKEMLKKSIRDKEERERLIKKI